MKIDRNKLLVKLRYGSISNHPLLKDIHPNQREMVLARACYSRKYSFSYFRIPKAANSTITKTLFKHMYLNNAYLENDPTGRKAKKRLQHIPSQSQFDKSYSFTFVREPASRTLSAWLDKLQKTHFMDKYGLHKPSDKQSPLTFSEFLKALDTRALYWNPHWAPQSSLLPFKGNGYNFIGRVETLDRDLEHVCNAVFGRFDTVKTRELARTGAANKVNELITEADRKLIYKLYEEDYDLFYSDMLPV